MHASQSSKWRKWESPSIFASQRNHFAMSNAQMYLIAILWLCHFLAVGRTITIAYHARSEIIAASYDASLLLKCRPHLACLLAARCGHIIIYIHRQRVASLSAVWRFWKQTPRLHQRPPWWYWRFTSHFRSDSFGVAPSDLYSRRLISHAVSIL